MNRSLFFLLFSLFFVNTKGSISSLSIPSFLYLLVTKDQWRGLALRGEHNGPILTKTTGDLLHPVYTKPYSCSALYRSQSEPEIRAIKRTQRVDHVILLTFEQQQIYRPLLDDQYHNPILLLECTTKRLSGDTFTYQSPPDQKESFFYYHNHKAPGALPLAAITNIFAREENPNAFDARLITDAITTPDQETSEIAKNIDTTALANIFD